MRRITVAFVLISAIFSTVFATLFVLDLRGFFNLAQDPVAVLKTASGTVRRLAHKELTWDRAESGTLFGAGDTISTGELARAKLVFYAGGELDLDAGAMVVLGGNVDELKLDFVSGTGRIRVAKEAANKITVAAAAEPAVKGRNPGPKAGKKMAPRVQVAVVEKIAVPEKPPAQVLTKEAQVARQAEQKEVAAIAAKAPASKPNEASSAGSGNAPSSESASATSPTLGSEAPSTGMDTGETTPSATIAKTAEAGSESNVPSSSGGAAAGKPSAADAEPSGGAESLADAEPADPENEMAQSDLIALAPAIREEKIREPEKALGAGKKDVAGEILSAVKLPPVPSVKFPASDTVIDLGVQRGSKLEWDMPLDFKASEYEVVVRPADGKGAERILRSKGTSLALNQLSKGKYLWSVRALDEKGKRGPASDARWLEVRVPANMAKPKVLPVKIE